MKKWTAAHLHVDHVGWNPRLLDGEWIPTFSRAGYLFGVGDIECWSHSSDPLHVPSFADSVRPVTDAAIADAVDTDTARPPPDDAGTHTRASQCVGGPPGDHGYRFAPQP
jgi:hypothetical protein